MALLLLGSALFADDAKVMPKMVGRFYIAPTFAFAPGEYDTDGDYHSFDDSVKVFNLGFVLEFGVIDWISAAVQWAPGWTIWSDVGGAASAKTLLGNTGSTSDVNTNGVADLFVGAKIQIVGEKAPVQTSMFRLSVAPGVIIPLPGPDFEDEVKSVMKSEKATISKMDNHVLGAGMRFYFDYIINQNFFINLYNETIFYPVKQDLNKDGPNFYAAKGGMAQNTTIQGMLGAATPQIMNIDGEVNYKYRLTFEIEPVFTYPVADGVSFSAGLPINYRYIPAYEYSFDFPAAISGAAPNLEPLLLGYLNTDPQHKFYINPNVSTFLTKTPLPLEFKLQYGIPLYGQNVNAQHNLTLQIRAYFKI